MLYLYYADLFLQYLHSNAYTVLFAGTDAAPVAGTPVGVKDNLTYVLNTPNERHSSAKYILHRNIR